MTLPKMTPPKVTPSEKTLPENHPRLAKRSYGVDELIADGFIHALAIVVGLIAFGVLIDHAVTRGALGDAFAFTAYAASFFLLFGFSCAYNMAPPSRVKWLLRRFDHASIYLLIAGTYTALLSQLPLGPLTIGLAAMVWIVALGGAMVKVVLPGQFDRASLFVYLALGWVGVIAAKPIIEHLPVASLILTLVGGLFYSVGVLFHRWHSLRFQNAIWHGFVAVAAACQYAGIAVATAG
jgi:hemolysin III